ncbi:MAG TPA: mechanosensitive ion channel family protein [Candidatus Sulfotelmatobacter sp.]|nr:mechanosensitive ion channel family protein [Candidatus Sulfotelmatobacter sp.]
MDSVALQLLNQPLLLPTAIAIIGMVVLTWLFPRPTAARVGFSIVFLAVYSYSLMRAGILPVRPAPEAFNERQRVLVQVLEIFWWFGAARLLVVLGRAFLLFDGRPHERKFATDLLAGAAYIGAIFAVVGLVFDLPVTGLLATSGVVAIVLGLALQSTLADLFSGIALNIERPYRIGDWIALEGDLEGQVTEFNWRATHVTTITRDDVVVPNSVVAKSRIVNYSFPTRIHGVKFTVSLHDGTPPARGAEILQHAIINCKEVLREPPPRVKASAFGAGSIDYSVRFFVAEYGHSVRVKGEVLDLIYRHAAWAGAPLSTPRQDIHMLEPEKEADRPPPAQGLIDRLPLFQSLPPSERGSVAALLTRREVAAGDTVVLFGEPGDSMYFIDRGIFSVTRQYANQPEEVSRLGPGEFFGEFAMLTGEPRSATVSALTPATIYELRKSDIAPILKLRPELKGELSRVLADRRATNDGAQARPELVGEDDATLAARLFERFESFFRARH